jgi:hypothetical protein
MTCKELRHYGESKESGATVLPDSAEWAKHAAICPDCHRFIEERKELGKLLQLVRDSAPRTPASLDCAVLDGYRRFLSGQHRSVVAAARWASRISLGGALGWAAAVAFACVVAYAAMLLLIPYQHGHVRHVREWRPVVASQTVAHEKPAIDRTQASRRQTLKPVASNQLRRQPTSTTEPDALLPTGFHGLMYCDQFSCPGAMDVIRLELPPPVLGVTPASAPAHGFVSADVLVGPDGIARGIRVVQ